MKNTEELNALLPQKAVDSLLEGNQRFIKGEGLEHNTQQKIEETKSGQHPFAVVVACMDSRVAPEIIFDQSIGDIFVIRVAGSVMSKDVLGSIEYACKAVGSKCVLVLGHTKCGAVTGACQDVKMGNLTSLLAKIMPAVKEAQNEGNHILEELVENVNKKNIANSIQSIKTNSSVLKELIDDGSIIVKGAVYDVNTGKVSLL